MHLGLNIILLAATVIVSLMAFSNVDLSNNLKFNAWLIKHKKQSWRFFSYALVHADFLHLFINMYVLYSFGDIVEQLLKMHFGFKGILYYGLLYVGGIIFSTLFDYRKHKDDPYYNAVGASGAVSAVVFASILLYPSGSIFIFPIPFSLPSWIFGVLYLIYSAFMGRRAKDNIGHNAHFSGAIFGILFTAIVLPETIGNFFASIF
jgi:membrane associated rhomboid family serine protease